MPSMLNEALNGSTAPSKAGGAGQLTDPGARKRSWSLPKASIGSPSRLPGLLRRRIGDERPRMKLVISRRVLIVWRGQRVLAATSRQTANGVIVACKLPPIPDIGHLLSFPHHR